MLFALCLFIYPPLSNYLADKNSAEVRAEYYKTIEQADNETVMAAITEAQKYNFALLPVHSLEEVSEAIQLDYNEVLNLNGDGIMGYIEIPNISVYLPIFHGTGTESLDNGVGHLIGSSVPVGGTGTHTVLTGHSGVAGNRLFSDLEQMSEGDIFYLHILNDTLVYRVTEIHKVEPYDTSLLSIQEDKDRCTLITCTPFGVNTHRLLVQADRIPYEDVQKMQADDNQGSEPVVSSWKKQYYTGLIIGGATMGCLISVGSLCVWLKMKKTKGSKQK